MRCEVCGVRLHLLPTTLVTPHLGHRVTLPLSSLSACLFVFSPGPHSLQCAASRQPRHDCTSTPSPKSWANCHDAETLGAEFFFCSTIRTGETCNAFHNPEAAFPENNGKTAKPDANCEPDKPEHELEPASPSANQNGAACSVLCNYADSLLLDMGSYTNADLIEM